MKILRIRLAAVGLFLFGLGWVPWPVTAGAHRILNGLGRTLDCRLTVERARWIPWRYLEMTDLRMETSGGGKLHWERIWIQVRPVSFLSGKPTIRGRLGKGRIDPASWGLRKPMVQEILSAGPIVEGGNWDLQIGVEKVLLRAFRLQGPVLRVEAKGWLEGRGEASSSRSRWLEGRQVAHLSLEGSLARPLLEEMDLLKPKDPPAQAWEPFRMLLDGSLPHPEISFASSFYTWSFKSRGERAS